MIAAQCLGFLNTPPLWESIQYDIQQFDFPHVDLHSFQPQSIPRNIRLGHQMEYVFKQLVEYSDTYRVMVYNLPIRQGERTMGEIDFILEDIKRSKIIHVELTYKFYIIDTEISEPSHRLIGPNRRDMFITKMEKIKNVQFSLLHSEEGSKALYENNINAVNVEHQCCFKAQLFQPFGSETVHIGPLNKGCLAGYWLHFDDFNKAEFAHAQFYMPSKAEWVINPHVRVEWKSHVEIMKDINHALLREKAPMIWLKNSTNEFDKLFVVWW